MTKFISALLVAIFCSCFSFGQNALFTSAALLTKETEIDFTFSGLQPGSPQTGKIQLAANPRFGFSFLNFTAREDFHQAGLYSLYFNRFEDTYTGTQALHGTKLTSSGGGLHYRYGWRGGRAGKNWLFHVSANAGAFFQVIQKTPKTSAAFPVTAEIAGVEGGFRLHALRKFGDAGFLAVSFPLLFLEMTQTAIRVENPALSSSQQQQSTFSQNITTMDRAGIEFGGGFYLGRRQSE